MNDRISERLADVHASLREQLDLAQRHFERLEQVLAARESRDIATLNRAVRRLRASESQQQWCDTLVGAAQSFAGRAMLFTLEGNNLHLAAPLSRGIDDVPLDSAPAFRSAVETRDTVIALRTRGELSGPMADLLGEAPDSKSCLFPIATRDRVVAVLYADTTPGKPQTHALELLTAVAGSVLENRSAQPVNDLVKIEEPDLHLRAQRFARSQVAEIRLYKSEDVKAGRSARDLYASLKTEIDSAREVFRRDFFSANGEMPDYLHLELVHTLANDEEVLLGPGYPGPLA